MSTNLPKTNLALIFHYGREALGNRRKDLLLITVIFILVPNLLAYLAWQSTAIQAVDALNSMTNMPAITEIESLFATVSSLIVAPSLAFGVLKILGILTLARSCVDYFESRPGSIGSVISRAGRVLLTKGLGVVLILIIISPVIFLMPFLRALAMSMLVMLPVTLVAGGNGGLRTTWETIFLKYATTTSFGRWPVFINVLSVTGIFLTALFGVSLLIDQISVLDTIFEMPAGILDKTISIPGIQMNAGLLISGLMNLIWESFAITMIIPFTAAIYHLSTAPSDHVPFSTNA